MVLMLMARGLRWVFVVAVMTALPLIGGPVPVAHAATFTVNSTADAVDSVPGDGLCATAEGVCTLRAAIQEANALAGGDSIILPAGLYTLTIAGSREDAGATGDLDVTDNLTINGAGPATTVIDGGGIDRVLHIGEQAAVRISGVTIRNGNASGGGGVLNLGTLELENAIVAANVSPFGAGGGIASSGPLTLHRTTVRGNTAFAAGGIQNFHSSVEVNDGTVSDNTATVGSGGGIQNLSGRLEINSSIVAGNTALPDSGGGIYNSFGAVAGVTDTAVSGNQASFGGGIHNDGGTLELTRSTVSGNSATVGGGGGARNQTTGMLVVTNSTISGNTATGPFITGGGIQNFATLLVHNSTVAGNTASGFEASGGGIGNFASATLKDTIVANNAGGDCSFSIVSAGHNLIQNTTSCTISGDTTGNITGSDPLLGPLADNGGPTPTHALLAGSPAIDAGSADCPPPATDQRGVARPQGAACDIGAYERVEGRIRVALDVKPDSFPNPINPHSSGVIPVAILTTDSFDATTVDVQSLRFGPGGAAEAHGHGHLEDVNGDGRLDVVLHFHTEEAGFRCGDTSASLTGETLEGRPIEGFDTVLTVGCK